MYWTPHKLNLTSRQNIVEIRRHIGKIKSRGIGGAQLESIFPKVDISKVYSFWPDVFVRLVRGKAWGMTACEFHSRYRRAAA